MHTVKQIPLLLYCFTKLIWDYSSNEIQTSHWLRPSAWKDKVRTWPIKHNGVSQVAKNCAKLQTSPKCFQIFSLKTFKIWFQSRALSYVSSCCHIGKMADKHQSVQTKPYSFPLGLGGACSHISMVNLELKNIWIIMA